MRRRLVDAILAARTAGEPAFCHHWHLTERRASSQRRAGLHQKLLAEAYPAEMPAKGTPRVKSSLVPGDVRKAGCGGTLAQGR